jgi:hypothetical protein
MIQARKIIISVVALSSVIIIAYFVHVLEVLPRNSLESLLRKSIQSKRGAILNIQDITPFKWDKLDIYTPYTSYKDEKGKTIDIDEGHCLLVFSDNGVPVSKVKYKRYYGDFSGLHREGGYSPSSARFRVSDQGQSKWLKLEWAQMQSSTRPVER